MKPLGPEEDGTYPPYDGVVSVAIIACEDLLAADSNGLSDPYVKVQLGGTWSEKS